MRNSEEKKRFSVSRTNKLSFLKPVPNIITFLGLIFSFFALIFTVKAQFIWAAIMILLTGLSDVLDGVMARKTKSISKFGSFFDSVIDRFSEVFIFLGLIIYFYPINQTLVIVTLLALTGSLITSYLRAKAESLAVSGKTGLMQRGERFILLILAFFLSAILDSENLFLSITIWLIAIFSHLTILQRIWFVKNQLKQ